MNKKALSERDICTKFITPAIESAGWDVTTQEREEFPLTAGRIIVRGKLHTRAKNKRADYVLFYKPNIPIAIIEAKDNKHVVGDGFLFGEGSRKGRKVTEYAWKISADALAKRNYNLDCKNPHEVTMEESDPEELMQAYLEISKQLEAAQQALKAELIHCLDRK